MQLPHAHHCCYHVLFADGGVREVSAEDHRASTAQEAGAGRAGVTGRALALSSGGVGRWSQPPDCTRTTAHAHSLRSFKV